MSWPIGRRCGEKRIRPLANCRGAPRSDGDVQTESHRTIRFLLGAGLQNTDSAMPARDGLRAVETGAVVSRGDSLGVEVQEAVGGTPVSIEGVIHVLGYT